MKNHPTPSDARSLARAVFYCAILFLAVTCDKFESISKKEQQPSLTNEELRRLVLLDTNFVYPISMAINDVKEIARDFDKSDKINSTPRTIKEIVVVNAPDRPSSIATANAKPSDSRNVPEVYAFNFNDNRGFVVISADKRALGVLGASADDTIDSLVHNGLKIFLTRTVPYVQHQRAQAELLRDSVFDDLVVKLGGQVQAVDSRALKNGRTADNIRSCPNQITTSVVSSTITRVNLVSDPLIKTRWDQGPPYNNNFTSGRCVTWSDYCKYSNTNFLAGCVPISEGQVVAHFYAQKNTAWCRIVDAGVACSLSTSDQALVAKLTRDIFGEYGSSALGCLGTGAGTPFSSGNHGISAKYGLRDGEFRSYNINDIRNSLSQGSPVIISGYVHLFCFLICWGYGGGHQWIIDGMKDETTAYTVRVTGRNAFTCSSVNYTYSYSSTRTKLNFNWGWGGDSNINWVTEGVFGPVGYENKYNQDVKIIAYISPI